MSGSGKTVSMLHLKTSLRESLPGMRVIVAYLGFNANLMLDDEELTYLDKNPKTGVQEVLARRLAAATVISLENHEEGIRLLPLGKGIALNWLADPAEGLNIPLDDDDATLISKRDFHKLVTDVVDGLSDKQFTSQCSDGMSKATAINIVAAAFWPRVRLLQWWRNGETVLLHQHAPDANSKKWVKLLCYWLRGDIFSFISDQDDVLGKGDEDGSIRCLFQLNAEDAHFSVIPDGYSSEHLIDVLSEQLPAPHLYDGLRVIKSLQPKEFILGDAYAFENLGFFTVGTSIHVGLHALN